MPTMSQRENLPRHSFVKLKLCLFALAALTVARSSLAEMLESAGITEPICDVVLSASVPGIVSAWRFKEGDFVKEGEAIVDLDKRLEELEVERRKLAMDNRRTEYE